MIPVKIILALAALMALPLSCKTQEYEEEQQEEYEDDGKFVYLDLKDYSSYSGTPTEEELTELWDVLHVASCVQGIVNREKPRVYISYTKEASFNTDDFWWNIYRQPGKWLSGTYVEQTKSVTAVVRKFKSFFKGLVVYDPNVASTSNVASTIAGVEDLIAVRYDPSSNSMYSRLKALGLKEKVWLLNEDGTSKFKKKTEPYEWAIENYLEKGKCSGRYAGYYIDQFWIHNYLSNVGTQHHNLNNQDFFISKKAFFFDLSPWVGEVATDAPNDGTQDGAVFKRILLTIYNQNGGQQFCHIGGFPAWAYKYTNFSTGSWSVGGTHHEGDTEWEMTMLCGAYNAYIDADALGLGILSNASFWQHYPLEESYPQKWVTRDELKAKGYLKEDGTVDESKKYILFYIGDYDSAAWLSQTGRMMWRDDSARGKLPLAWAISPVLADRVPHVMDYIRKNATENDYFIAADNGAGYLNPSMLQEPRKISMLPSGLDAWKEHCSKYYEKWGLTVTGFIIDGHCNPMNTKALDCYASFSPNGIFPQKMSITDRCAALYNNMPIRLSGPTSSDDVSETVSIVLNEIAACNIPFTWYRTVLKSPSWHLQVKEELEKRDPDIVWMDAPSYMELLRCYLEQNQ